LAITAAAGLAITGIPTTSAASPAAAPTKPDGLRGPFKTTTPKDRPANYDARSASSRAEMKDAAALVAKRGPAFAAFERSLGAQPIVDYDALTGTPRNLGSLDGFLTGRSAAQASTIAMDYVRAHLADLGLTRSDLATFHLRQDYVDIGGIHHLSWTQSVKGITVFSNGLKANVTKDGQLISIQGSPVSGLGQKASTASAVPRLSAAQARAAAAKDVGGAVASAHVVSSSPALVKWSNNDQAQLVWFLTQTGLRLGWSTYVQAGGTLNYQHVIDAATGQVLYRHDTTDFDAGDARVFNNYPGAKVNGRQTVVNLYRAGFLPASQHTWLRGNYVIAWDDVNDDNVAELSEHTPVPGYAHGATWKFIRFRPFPALCSPQYQCSWKPSVPYSWRTNRKDDNTQGFYYDSVYHNYLEKWPFGFTAAAGNFELSGGDPVLLNSLDGADTDNGFPDANHIDNANMSTPPDGIPPTMQMYLWHLPHTSPSVEPYIPTSGSFDPSIILHEYTHGLSNRLVVDAQGNSTLNSIQAGAMGEAWSDYYALDFLVRHGDIVDTPKDGEVLEGSYVLAAKEPFRTEAIDCSVHSTAANCTQLNGQKGGYTYGDFATVGGTPEVHSSGEIWAQTLWQLRTSIGADHADAIITRAMSLSPADPSYLDMRNAILQANLALYQGAKQNWIWDVFDSRGMGWYAGTIDAGDTNPQQGFRRPPSPETPRSSVVGKVTDGTTGDPVAGALVEITGHNSGYAGDYTAVTNAAGTYQIPNVYIGTYKLAVVQAPGYEVLSGPLAVLPGTTKADFSPRRDWAAASGGGTVADYNGPDYSADGCGPSGSIDLGQGTGWGSTTGDDQGDPTGKMIPKFVEIKLPRTVTVKSFAVNPSNTCGDPGSSSTGKYRIDVSADGKKWTTAVKGTFDATQRQLNQISIDKPIENVNYVEFWMLSPQVPDFKHNCPDGPYGGCTFTDMTELEVFGSGG
jgi:Zn-dependent metalloprotease